MAMIGCVECEALISDRAEKCGQCGCPVQVSLEAISKGEGVGVRTTVINNVPEKYMPFGYAKMFNAVTNEELGRFSLGDTLILKLKEPIQIKFDKNKEVFTIKPGMAYQVNVGGGFFKVTVTLTELGKA